MSHETGCPSVLPLAPEVTKLRLVVLRSMYGFIVAGLAIFVWPGYLQGLPHSPHLNGIVMTMLAAFSLLCALGILYPLRMLPVLLWELLWKSMWLLLIALPRWMDGSMDALTSQTVIDCLIGVVLVPLALPWSYVAAHYFKGHAQVRKNTVISASSTGQNDPSLA